MFTKILLPSVHLVTSLQSSLDQSFQSNYDIGYLGWLGLVAYSSLSSKVSKDNCILLPSKNSFQFSIVPANVFGE